jgi:4-hydroxy-2-oxoglutarate aldolase
MPTVFDAAGDVDVSAIRFNVERWMRTDLVGVLALGSNGEAPCLDDVEGDRVVAAAREAMPKGRTLLVGTGRESTRQTIAVSKRAAALGADAVLVRTPFFFKPQMTNDALISHYTAIADASPVPVLLYNMPHTTGVTLTPPVVAVLSRHDNIIGVKETSVELERLGQFVAAAPAGFTVLCGAAPVIYPALVSGAGGGILAAACVAPERFTALREHARSGNHADALKLQQQLTPLARLVTTVHSVAGLKAAMDMAGYRGGVPRAPMAPLSAAGAAEIRTAIEHLSSLVPV